MKVCVTIPGHYALFKELKVRKWRNRFTVKIG